MTALPYGATVLEHFRRPRNQRRLAEPTASSEANNPLCGDRVRVELHIVDSVIRAAAFTANACALCTASASLLTERLHGASLGNAMAITEDETIDALETDVPPGRRLCAVLPLRALRDAIDPPATTA